MLEEEGPTVGSVAAADPRLDRSTLEGVRRRDSAALATFFDATFGLVYSLAYRLLGDPHLAEDATQDVFVKVHGAADRLDVDRSPKPWLTTITYNVCRDAWRKGKSARQGLEAHAGNTPHAASVSATPEDTLVESQRAHAVQQAISRLDEPLRTVVVLRDYQGCSHDEIATLVGVSHVAVRKRYSRALKQLREWLRDESI